MGHGQSKGESITSQYVKLPILAIFIPRETQNNNQITVFLPS